MPALRSLIVGDTAGAWTTGGFTVAHHHGRATTAVGDVEIELVGPDDGGGIVAWRFDDPELPSSIDGITTLRAGRAVGEAEEPSHANLATQIDHVVMLTPDLDRTVLALERAGFEARRVRDVPGSEPLRKQVFFWAGSSIIELVGPATPTGDGPATLWGLAMTCSDLDAAGEVLGDRLGRAKPAVQPGRRIATLRTRELGISVPIAFLSPHPTASGEHRA